MIRAFQQRIASNHKGGVGQPKIPIAADVYELMEQLLIRAQYARKGYAEGQQGKIQQPLFLFPSKNKMSA